MSRITERYRGIGDFTVKLRDDTPDWITQELGIPQQGWAHVIVTPARYPVWGQDSSGLFDLSIFTGVYRGRGGRLELRGSSAAIWLGDEQGKGSIPVAPLAHTSGSFVDWMTDLKPATLLQAGTYHAQSGTLTWDAIYKTRRAAIDFVCAHFGAAWRVNHDLTLDAGTPAELFGTTPTAFLAPDADGPDPDMGALRCTLTPERDVEGWLSDATLLGDGVTGTGTTGSVAFQDILGNDLVWREIIEDGSVDDAGVADIQAQAYVDANNSPRRAIKATTDTPLPTTICAPGDAVWIADPREGIYDFDNEVRFRGQVRWPEAIRLMQVTWGIPPGCGVFVRQHDGTVIDLSDWYKPDLGRAELHLDQPPRGFRRALRLAGVSV